VDESLLPIVYVCQARRCGRLDTPRKFVRRWWLIAPNKNNPNNLVIRCPEHYTEWALQQTVYGRLTALREHAREARMVGKKLKPVTGLEPRPREFLGFERGDAQADVPDPFEFLDDLVVQKNRTHWTKAPWSEEQRAKLAEKRRLRTRDAHGMFSAQRRM